MEEGISGLIVDNVEQAVAAVGHINDLDRAEVRAAFERRFTISAWREITSIFMVALSARRRLRREPRAFLEPVNGGGAEAGFQSASLLRQTAFAAR